MTHQQMIDYWEKEIQKHVDAQQLMSTTYQIAAHKQLEMQARNIYMQLCTMDTEAPIVSTGTTFNPIESISSVDLEPEYSKVINDNFWELVGDSTKPCNHIFDITGRIGFKCIKCGAHPGDISVNASHTQK